MEEGFFIKKDAAYIMSLNGANVSEVKGLLKKISDMIRGWKFQSLPCRIFLVV